MGNLLDSLGITDQFRQIASARDLRNRQVRTLDSIAPLAGTYAQNGYNAGQNVNRFGPQFDSAVQRNVDYLQRDPFTDPARTQIAARASANVGTNYQAGQSRIRAGLARRGIGGGILAGALANNDAAASSALIGAGQHEADYEQSYRDAQPGQLVDFLGRTMTGYRDNQADALRGQAGIYNTLAGGYGGIAGGMEEALAQKRAQQQAQEAQYFQTALGLGGLIF